MKNETENKQGSHNDGNASLVAGTNEGMSIGFTCEICSGTQTLPPAYYRVNQIFPVCDECKKDLKEFVVSKRQGACH